jgi:hypothetical protein
MRAYQGEATEGSDAPSTTAAAELATHVDDIVRNFSARVAPPVDAAALEALRADILELAKGHAARTLLEVATAKQRAPRRSRWGRRP